MIETDQIFRYRLSKRH